jgi:hypothetical protein
MNKSSLQLIKPLILLFVAFSAFSVTGKQWLEKQGIQQDVVLVGNLVLFAVSLLAYYINVQSVKSSNPQSSVRAMYGSFMLKFFVIAIVAFVYIMMTKKNVNKPGLMICAGLYIIYTALETRALMRLTKERKNA